MIEVKPGGRCIVAIPARDEESRIGACLAALAADPCPAPLTVILFANDCEDRTCDVARHAAGSCGLDLRIIEECLPSGRRHVGEARGRAMEAAARLARPADVLLTTDADSRVQPGWRAANLHAIADGADLVCGVAVIDPVEALAIDPRLHEDDARECAYGALLDEIAALLDPDPADPWPRHLEESGASIAIRAEVFRHIGGVPCVAIGEDRALVRRAAALDARIRHDPQIRVIVSGRLQGRAAGGMADTIRRRMQCQDDFIDARLEPVSHWLRRVRLRAAVRAARRSGLMDLAPGRPPWRGTKQPRMHPERTILWRGLVCAGGGKPPIVGAPPDPACGSGHAHRTGPPDPRSAAPAPLCQCPYPDRRSSR
jgi:GT2 family glycosyltransferase